MKRAAALLVLATLVSFLPALAGGSGARRLAPDFIMTDLSGVRVSLRDLRGDAVIVLFGRLDCAACLENDRLLRNYQLQYVTHGLTVVSLHGNATLKELRRYDARFNFSVLTGADPGDAVARQYGARPPPTAVFIDREGYVRGIHRGQLEEETLLRALQTLLGGAGTRLPPA